MKLSLRIGALLASTAASALCSSAAHAQTTTLQWVEPQTVTEGCASSISVAPNNIPLITGCGSGPDNPIYYLGQQACSQPHCFASLAWVNAPGLNAAHVFEDLNGDAFAVDSGGHVYAGVTNQTPADNVAQLSGWSPLWDQSNTCMTLLAPGLNSGDTEANFTPPTYQTEPFIFGIGCGVVDSANNRGIYSWNLNLTVYGTSLYWNTQPGWQQLQPGVAGAAQIAMFTEPGPSNPQVPWVRNQQGELFSYNGYEFVPEPSPPVLVRKGTPAPKTTWVTDHFALRGGFVYSWNDGAQRWSRYVLATTGANTQIVQIAASQPINTDVAGTVGPSSLWGIDNVGHVFFLEPVTEGT